jgi:hypothetical protein
MPILFSEAFAGAICGQNIRMVRKKNYGPSDLSSCGSQTDASDNDLAKVETRQYWDWYASDAYIEWREIETKSEAFVEWYSWASSHWLDWWHAQAQSWSGRFPTRGPRAAVYDKAEVEYRLYVDFCEERDSVANGADAEIRPFILPPTPWGTGEAGALQPPDTLMNAQQEKKLLRVLKNMH